MNTYFVPLEAGPTDPVRRGMLDALVGEDAATFSPREQALVDSAVDHGELYWATVEPCPEGKGWVVSTDMGHPEATVRLWVPAYTPHKRALEALDAAVQVMMRVD